MDILKILMQCTGFEWDKENLQKNWDSHQVGFYECEEIFFNQPFVIEDDTQHSQSENRYYALGKTDRGRLLFVVFTVRRYLIRVISARDMSRKERTVYESYEEK